MTIIRETEPRNGTKSSRPFAWKRPATPTRQRRRRRRFFFIFVLLFVSSSRCVVAIVVVVVVVVVYWRLDVRVAFRSLASVAVCLPIDALVSPPYWISFSTFFFWKHHFPVNPSHDGFHHRKNAINYVSFSKYSGHSMKWLKIDWILKKNIVFTVMAIRLRLESPRLNPKLSDGITFHSNRIG